jgi:pyruvyltransferase
MHAYLLLLMFFITSTDVFFAEIRNEGLPLFYWQSTRIVNFGDYLSYEVVKRMVGAPVRVVPQSSKEKKLLAIGSIIRLASQGDVIWGSGVKGTSTNGYHFTGLDVRAVRGPLTRTFLTNNFGIVVPEIYGDPALLVPQLFPEFRKKQKPRFEYLIVPHYSEQHLFPKADYSHVVYPTEPWDVVIRAILDSKFVISGSLHGIIVAEAFGIPARWLRVSSREPVFKFYDYYLGTGRAHAQPAYSIEEALAMGGEPPVICDLEKLYHAFPFEFWTRDGVAMTQSSIPL